MPPNVIHPLCTSVVKTQELSKTWSSGQKFNWTKYVFARRFSNWIEVRSWYETMHLKCLIVSSCSPSTPVLMIRIPNTCISPNMLCCIKQIGKRWQNVSCMFRLGNSHTYENVKNTLHNSSEETRLDGLIRSTPRFRCEFGPCWEMND